VWSLPYLESDICITQNISETSDLQYYQQYLRISTVSYLFSVFFSVTTGRKEEISLQKSLIFRILLPFYVRKSRLLLQNRLC